MTTTVSTEAGTYAHPCSLRLVVMLLGTRLRSARHKAHNLLAQWPGRIVFIGVILASARLLWILVAPPPDSALANYEELLHDVLGALLLSVTSIWGSRSLSRVPAILNTGDVGIADPGLLIRSSLTASILARLPVPVIGGLYLTAVLVGLAPTQWTTLDTRVCLWAALGAFGVWMASARLAGSCVAWVSPRARQLLILAWWFPVAVVLCVVIPRVPEQGAGALNLLGDIFMTLTEHWLSAMLLVLGAAFNYAVIVVCAPWFTPLWALPAYQIAAILDLADSRDPSAALALTRPAYAHSGRVPGFVNGPVTFSVRQWWEAGRRHTGRVLVFKALAAYGVGRLIGWLLPEWWPIAFLIVGGFAASSCALDGALAEARYPLFSAASSTRRNALCVGAWSCLLPASQTCLICLLNVLGGAHSRLSGQTVTITLGCAITWPIISAACSVAAALLSIRGVPSRLSGGVGGLAALGGPLTLAVGLGTAALAPGYAVFAAQAVAAALASWALLHLALASWSASRYTVRTNQGADLTDLSNTINSPAGTEE